MSKLKFGICGTISPDTSPQHNPLPLLRKPLVQDALLALSDSPMSKSELYRSFSEVQEDIEQLISLGFLREQKGRLTIHFTFLNLADKQLVYDTSDRYAKDLAHEILQHHDRIQDILSAYPNHHVPTTKLAFLIVGCYFLDWGSLEFMKLWQLMNFGKKQAGGNQYTLWAEANVQGSLQGVYWGGHSYLAGDYLLHSFGDHHSRRYAFPDIIYPLPPHDFKGSHPYKRLLFEKQVELAKDIGVLLATVGKKGVAVYSLVQQLGWDEKKVNYALQFLQDINYLEQEGDTLHLCIPYFTPDDLDMMEKAISTLAPILEGWAKTNYGSLEHSLKSIECMRNGVPFDEVFIQVWHYIFGLTNKYLAQEGFMYDTYAKDSDHPGYVPALTKGPVLKALMERLQAQ